MCYLNLIVWIFKTSFSSCLKKELIWKYWYWFHNRSLIILLSITNQYTFFWHLNRIKLFSFSGHRWVSGGKVKHSLWWKQLLWKVSTVEVQEIHHQPLCWKGVWSKCINTVNQILFTATLFCDLLEINRFTMTNFCDKDED